MVFEKLYSEIERRVNPSNKAVVILGVSGNMGAGKGHFSAELGDFLKSEKGISNFYWNQDRHQKSRKEKEAIRQRILGTGQILDSYNLSKAIYFDSYSWDEMLLYLTRIKNRESIVANDLYQKASGERNLRVSIPLGESNERIVIVYVGGFIMHQPVRNFFDVMIVIECEKEERFKRMYERARKLEKPYELKRERFNELDDFTTRYLEENRSSDDLRIDNDNFGNRKIII